MGDDKNNFLDKMAGGKKVFDKYFDMVFVWHQSKMGDDKNNFLDKMAGGKKVFDKYFDMVFKVFVPIYKYGFVPSVILYGMFFTEPKPHIMQILMPTM
eukprot:TRINITY_DN30944_c0_g2_i1.p3 TRINITY_DN30944_c0_g2~~TRINITY_DN30944_c0_g2_i1.p3  ORF type:complete len:111 (+),score=17.41 TRINITY_DN30944_c0_g2_i1:42-335(+)